MPIVRPLQALHWIRCSAGLAKPIVWPLVVFALSLIALFTGREWLYWKTFSQLILLASASLLSEPRRGSDWKEDEERRRGGNQPDCMKIESLCVAGLSWRRRRRRGTSLIAIAECVCGYCMLRKTLAGVEDDEGRSAGKGSAFSFRWFELDGWARTHSWTDVRGTGIDGADGGAAVSDVDHRRWERGRKRRKSTRTAIPRARWTSRNVVDRAKARSNSSSGQSENTHQSFIHSLSPQTRTPRRLH
jgi:hypothetical protein